jgi:hypothetical protein
VEGDSSPPPIRAQMPNLVDPLQATVQAIGQRSRACLCPVNDVAGGDERLSDE